MNHSTELAIVIPVYNESEVIVKVIESWNAMLEQLKIGYQIHVYNDGSKDNTLVVLQDLAKKYPLLFVHDKPNSGHGSTILKGYRENDTATWIFQVDSDNEMRPETFEKMWQERNNYDFLIGIRHDRHSPIPRKIISMISRTVVWTFYGKGVWDVNSPYRLMRSSVFKKVFQSIPYDTFAPNLIVSGMASKMKSRIFEIQTTYYERETGVVSIKKWKLFKVSVKSLIQTCRYSLKK